MFLLSQRQINPALNKIIIPTLFGQSLTMNIHDQYTTTFRPSPYVLEQYRTPQEYLDSAKIIEQRRNMKYKHHRSQGKFKPSKRQKQFFIDQMIKSIKENPGPSKYKIGLDLLDAKKQSKNVNNVVKPNAIKKTYIDEIELKQQKQKAPGIGKYNLLTLTDFSEKKTRKSKSKLNPERLTYFDDKITQSIYKPGPGEHNPHPIQKKIIPERTSYKFYQEKHEDDKKKIKRSLSAKLGPNTYNPVFSNTFDSLKLKSKHPSPSKWSHGTIEIRKGLKSACKHPSPAQYKLINQWSPQKSLTARNNSISEIGRLKLFDRTIKSARLLNVYRD